MKTTSFSCSSMTHHAAHRLGLAASLLLASTLQVAADADTELVLWGGELFRDSVDNANPNFQKWEDYAAGILQLREGHGRTLLICPYLPRQKCWPGQTRSVDTINNRINAWNASIGSYSNTDYPSCRICKVPAISTIPHDQDEVGPDDGIHYFSVGYERWLKSFSPLLMRD